MRVSNSMIYDTNLKHMQTSLANYMETNIQGGTQKKINKPSDDPAGTALVLNSRANIAATEQYQRNVDTARGWLELTDATLQEASATLIKIETLANQAATGTMSEENRDQIATQLEQLFGQLLNLSNMEYQGKSIFGGHNYLENAYEEGLGVHTYDEGFDTAGTSVTGKADSSMSLRFLNDGVVGVDTLNYEWSKDGGKTWTDGTLPAGQTGIDINGVQINMREGTTVKAPENPDTVDTKDGTFLMIYPTAIYMGDDSDAQPYGNVTGGIPGLHTDIHADVDSNVLMELTADADLRSPGSPVAYRYSTNGGLTWTDETTSVPNPATNSLQLPFTNEDNKAGFIVLDTSNSANGQLTAGMQIDMQPRRVDMLNGPDSLQLNAQGIFSQNVAVRLDEPANLSLAGSDVHYSYSQDGGQTWIKSISVVPNPAGAATLTVPGGFLELSPQAGTTSELDAGTQMVIHPDRAALDYEIMENSSVPVNQVGKDIFGGIYQGQSVEGFNMFDSVGKLIAFCENGESDGIGDLYDEIKNNVHVHFLTPLAAVGGIENRLDLADSMLESEKLDQETRLSYTEDIDLTELLNQLAKDELAYSTVLKSASMILQTNLTKYI